jgi:hypothetical protein
LVLDLDRSAAVFVQAADAQVLAIGAGFSEADHLVGAIGAIADRIALEKVFGVLRFEVATGGGTEQGCKGKRDNGPLCVAHGLETPSDR